MARKKNPHKKLAHPKKTNNMTGNRTPGRHRILALPRLRLYPLTRSSEVLTSGNPTLLKVKTEKKNLIEIDLTHSQLKKILLYVCFPNLLQVRTSQTTWFAGTVAGPESEVLVPMQKKGKTLSILQVPAMVAVSTFWFRCHCLLDPTGTSVAGNDAAPEMPKTASETAPKPRVVVLREG